VTCERCLNRDFRGFEIAHFADHDDIGVLSEDGTQRGRKAQSYLRLDLDLINPSQLVFHRILNGEDFPVGCIDRV
jgi:hypothetical protein